MTSSTSDKRIVIIAGPNGAGKTTFAREFLPTDVEMAIERVTIRVRQGGHNIPEDVIRRRYAHGIANFERYKLLVDSWQLYDNSDTPAVLIEEGQSK